MSESFVPLWPHLPRGGGTNTGSIPTLVVTQQHAANRFQPMIGREPASPAANGFSAPPFPAPGHTCASQPRVTLVREGDVVKRIQVHCGCGQLIELDCL